VLSTLGDEQAAMERFKKALLAPNSNRVSVRLAIARLLAQGEQTSDAERQIALAQMEADAGDTVQPTGDQYVQAADTFQKMHEYELSQSYLQRARPAGASDAGVRVGLANTYLGLGETKRAAAELAGVKQTDDSELNYQYLLAKAAVFQQEHRETQAVSAFAEAVGVAGEDQTAQQSLLQAGATEGFRLNPNVSVLSNLIVQPIFEDSTVYVLDSKLNSPSGPVSITDIARLPPPRSSLETSWINVYHLHRATCLRLAASSRYGTPARDLRARNQFESCIAAQRLHLELRPGSDDPPGDQRRDPQQRCSGAIRRDSLSPVQLNQNLFRAFTYFSTSSFLNAVSANGFVSGELDPFTETPVSERSLASAVNFRVGAPWSKTALVTGWGMNHQRFPSSQRGNSENYYTSSYIGLTHRFKPWLGAEAIVETSAPGEWSLSLPFIRPSRRLFDQPQRLPSLRTRSGASRPPPRTRAHGAFTSTTSIRTDSRCPTPGRSVAASTTKLGSPPEYPIRISGGIRQETFLNFTQGHNLQFRPYVSISLF